MNLDKILEFIGDKVPKYSKENWDKYEIPKPTKNGYRDENGKQGEWEKYFQNGQLDYIGNYKNGKKNGYWEIYFEDGQLYYKGNYEDGNRVGYWEEYF
jgi:hypothetical protein